MNNNYNLWCAKTLDSTILPLLFKLKNNNNKQETEIIKMYTISMQKSVLINKNNINTIYILEQVYKENNIEAININLNLYRLVSYEETSNLYNFFLGESHTKHGPKHREYMLEKIKNILVFWDE